MGGGRVGLGGEGGLTNRGRLKWNSDASRGRSHKSFTVRDVGCEAHKKRWTKVCDSPPEEGQRDRVVLVLSSYNRKRWSCKRMNGAGLGKGIYVVEIKVYFFW